MVVAFAVTLAFALAVAVVALAFAVALVALAFGLSAAGALGGIALALAAALAIGAAAALAAAIVALCLGKVDHLRQRLVAVGYLLLQVRQRLDDGLDGVAGGRRNAGLGRYCEGEASSRCKSGEDFVSVSFFCTFFGSSGLHPRNFLGWTPYRSIKPPADGKRRVNATDDSWTTSYTEIFAMTGRIDLA